MSWHIEACGPKEDIVAMIDECVANPSGMPAAVGDYLKSAIAATPDGPEYNVYVKSNGHRPMTGSGSNEQAEVKVLRAKPWKPVPTPPA